MPAGRCGIERPPERYQADVGTCSRLWGVGRAQRAHRFSPLLSESIFNRPTV